MNGEWTPPKRVWIFRNPASWDPDHWDAFDERMGDHRDEHDIPYVPESRLAEVERERDAVKAKLERSRKATRPMVAEGQRINEENRALRARVEELEAAIEDLLDRKNDYPTDYGDSIAKAWREAFDRARDALLSGGSREEPRPKHDADCIRRGDGKPTSLCTCGLTDEQVRPDTGETCECGHRLTDHVSADGEPHVVCVAPLDTFPEDGFYGVCPCVRRDTTGEEDR